MPTRRPDAGAAGRVAGARVLLDTPMFPPLETGRPGDLQSPLVHARVEGRAARLIVDTGATETILTRAFAADCGLAVAQAQAGYDHSGAEVPTWTCLEPVRLSLDSHGVSLPTAAVVEAPPSFKKARIDGILCPQRLHDSATLVLDFASRRLRLVEGRVAEDRDQRGDAHRLHPVILDRVRLAGDEAHLIAVAGSHGPSPPAGFIFNTGTWEAEVAPEPGSPSGPRGAIRGRGLSGTPTRGPLLRNARISFGNIIVPAADCIVRSQRLLLGGQIGMQVLRSTRLEIHRRSQKIRWWVPEAWIRTSSRPNVRS